MSLSNYLGYERMRKVAYFLVVLLDPDLCIILRLDHNT